MEPNEVNCGLQDDLSMEKRFPAQSLLFVHPVFHCKQFMYETMITFDGWCVMFVGPGYHV